MCYILCVTFYVLHAVHGEVCSRMAPFVGSLLAFFMCSWCGCCVSLACPFTILTARPELVVLLLQCSDTFSIVVVLHSGLPLIIECHEHAKPHCWCRGCRKRPHCTFWEAYNCRIIPRFRKSPPRDGPMHNITDNLVSWTLMDNPCVSRRTAT